MYICPNNAGVRWPWFQVEHFPKSSSCLSTPANSAAKKRRDIYGPVRTGHG